MADEYLSNGFIGLMVQHPVTGKEVESLIPTSGYSQNQPGVAKLLADLKAGTLSKEHGDATVEDIAKHVFAELVEAKGAQYLLDAMARVDGTLKKAAKEAKLETWRAKLDAPDMAEAQEAARGMYADMESLKAQVADLEAKIAEARIEVGAQLDVDGTFDLALISSGWYISEESKPKGSRETVKRDYSADAYTSKDSRTIGGIKVASTAEVITRDDDGNPTQWSCKYLANGKAYTGVGDSLHQADKAARSACIDAIAPGTSKANNAPKWYRVPRIKA